MTISSRNFPASRHAKGPKARRHVRRVIAFSALVGLFAAMRAVPLPGVDSARVGEALQAGMASSGLLRLELTFADIVSGGSFLYAGVLALGVAPLASVRVGTRLLALGSPYFDRRATPDKQPCSWLPAIAVAVCAVQALGYALWLQSVPGVVVDQSLRATVLTVLVITTATAMVGFVARLASDEGWDGATSLASLAAIVVGLAAAAGLAGDMSLAPAEVRKLAIAATAIAAWMGAIATIVTTYRRKQSRSREEFERDVRKGGALGTAMLAIALLVSGAPKGVENLADAPKAEERAKRRNDAGDDPGDFSDA